MMSRRSSPVWKYFVDDEDGVIAHCRICVQAISYKSTTNNMKVHLKRKHGNAYIALMKETRSRQTSRKNSTRRISEVSDPDFAETEQLEEYVPSPANADIPEEVYYENDNKPLKSRRSSYVWNLFDDKNPSNCLAECTLCGVQISYRSTLSNLKSHLKRKHPRAVEVILNKRNYVPTYNKIDAACHEPVAVEPNQLEVAVKNITNNTELENTNFVQSLDNTEIQEEIYLTNETIQRKSRKSSYFWHYYNDDPENHIAECTLCGSSMSYKSSSTSSNLKIHLKRKHPLAFASLNTDEKYVPKDRQQDVSYKKPFAVESVQLQEAVVQSINFVEIPAAPLSYPPLSKQEQNTIPSKVSHIPRKNTLYNSKLIDEALLHLFIWDYQPFNIVEDKGFLRYTHSLNPSYHPPSKKAISSNLIPSLYADCRREMMEKVKCEALSVCLTTDTWTASSNDSYITITIHYTMKDSLGITSVLIDCIRFSERDTVEELSHKIQTTIDSWGLTYKILLAITDNSSTIVNTINLLGWNHFQCYAYTLNSCVDDALKVVTETLEKINKVVSFFRKNSTASEVLLKYQIQQKVATPKKLKQSVSTRWNSIYYMLQRIVELEEPVKATLALMAKEFDEDLTTHDWTICTELCTVLKPFEEVTTRMSSDDYTSGSMAIVLTRGLHRVCHNLLSKDYNENVENVLLRIQEGLSTRFNNIEYDEVLALCTFLDPRFKIHGFSDKLAANAIKKRAQDIIIANMDTEKNPNNLMKENSSKSKDISVWDDFDILVDEVDSTGTPLSRATREIQSYLEDGLLPRSESPTGWWKVNRHTYPNLANLFIKQGNFIATSIRCERIFSKAGYIINKRRTRLTAERVSQLVFLNANYK